MRKINALYMLLVLGLVAFLNGCNSGTQETATLTNDDNSGMGSVAVLLTDAPIDDFDQFFLTVTEISILGDDGKVAIFSGSERLNLLDLDSHADLFSLADNIPAGYYHKIRMRVSEPLLVKLDDEGNEIESIVPQMSGNGKLDLNPRSDLHVMPGETLAVQIDLDANKSIHLIQQGNGAYRFRPVVFVDVLTDDISGKLMRVSGFIGDIEDDGFELCRTGMEVEDNIDQNDNVLNSARTHRDGHLNEHTDDDNVLGQDDDIEDGSDSDHNEGENEHGDHHDHCIEVSTSSTHTAFFDANGDIISEVVLTEGEPATVLGYYQHLGRYHVGLSAQIVELADKDIYQQYPGEVDALDLDNHVFTLRDDNDALFTVELDEKSKFFSMTGEPLSVDDLEIGDAVKVEGMLIEAEDTIKAAAVFIKVEVPAVSQLVGTVSMLHDDLLGFDMSDATLGDVCVRVDDNSNYYLLTLDGDSFSSEEVGYSELVETQYVEVYGEFSLSGCFVAENILAETAEAELN